MSCELNQCASAVQLLRHTPRFEQQLNPTVRVEEITEKVTVRGSVIHVAKPVSNPSCSFLNFRVQVRLAASSARCQARVAVTFVSF